MVRKTVGSTGSVGPKMSKPGSSYSMRDIPATTLWDTATVGHAPMRALFNNSILGKMRGELGYY
jgi:hypothetical protein